MKTEFKLDRETAEVEFQRWADIKKLRPSKLEKMKDEVEEFVELLMDGILEIAESGDVTHNLRFDAAGKNTLVYKPRLKVGDLKGLNGDDIAKSAALIARIAGENKGITSNMEMNDFRAAQAVSIFYTVG